MAPTDRRGIRRAQREARKTEKKHRKVEKTSAVPSPKPRVHLPLLQQLPDWEAVSSIAGSALANGGTIASATNAVAGVGDLMDRELPAAFVKKPACQRGCSFCCYVHVDLTILELARAVRLAQERFTPEQLDALKSRAQVSAEGARGKTVLSYPVQPCAFLVDGECSVYDARPLACRAEHALDVEPCRQAYETGEDVPGERDMGVSARASVMRAALEATLKTAGFASHSYELQQALSLALNKPGAIEQWTRGKDMFAAARTGAGLLPSLMRSFA